jgi:hypothetical protein
MKKNKVKVKIVNFQLILKHKKSINPMILFNVLINLKINIKKICQKIIKIIIPSIIMIIFTKIMNYKPEL